jgi:hypothetical protein
MYEWNFLMEKLRQNIKTLKKLHTYGTRPYTYELHFKFYFSKNY